MGSAEPRSFSRGKRGIAGTLVFTVFNRDAIIEELNKSMAAAEGGIDTVGVLKFKANQSENAYVSIDEWDAQMTDLAGGGGNASTSTSISKLSSKVKAKYADEILPFDITITFANEYGQRAMLVIYGVELLNEGSGYSIDSVTTEKAYTFVARRIDHMQSIDNADDDNFSSTW